MPAPVVKVEIVVTEKDALLVVDLVLHYRTIGVGSTIEEVVCCACEMGLEVMARNAGMNSARCNLED